MRHRPLLTLLLLFLIGSSTERATFAKTVSIDRESLRAELRTLWESIESLSFRYDDFAVNDRGEPEPPGAYASREVLRFAPPERFAKRAWFRDEDGTWKAGYEFRLDGRRKVSLGYLEGHPEVLESVSISNLDTFALAVMSLGGTGGFLWMPEGQPIHMWLDERANVSTTADGNLVEVTFPITRGRSLSYTLERSRDWLPSRVRLALKSDGFVEYDVTEYQRDNGRWFLRAGRISSPDTEAGRGRRAFAFSDLKINRGFPLETFTVPPRLEEGIIVDDETRPRGKQVVGGFKALDRFERKYGLKAKPLVGTPIEATPDAWTFPWATTIGIVSAGALLVALLISVRVRFGPSPNTGDRP